MKHTENHSVLPVSSAVNAANARATAAHLRTMPTAVSAHYDQQTERVIIVLSSGLEIAFKPHDVPCLECACPSQLAHMELSLSGLEIHFPDLDKKFSLSALLEGFFGSWQWTAAHMGKVGGTSTSIRKTNAARANGRLGGRPRKVQPAQKA